MQAALALGVSSARLRIIGTGCFLLRDSLHRRVLACPELLQVGVKVVRSGVFGPSLPADGLFANCSGPLQDNPELSEARDGRRHACHSTKAS